MHLRQCGHPQGKWGSRHQRHPALGHSAYAKAPCPCPSPPERTQPEVSVHCFQLGKQHTKGFTARCAASMNLENQDVGVQGLGHLPLGMRILMCCVVLRSLHQCQASCRSHSSIHPSTVRGMQVCTCFIQTATTPHAALTSTQSALFLHTRN